jgi:signal transduction histidine kinase/ActR/RegA family two-component response regulator
MLRVRSEEISRLGAHNALEDAVVQSTVRAGSMLAAVFALLFSGLYALRGPVEFVPPNMLASGAFAFIAVIRTRDAAISLYSALTTGLLLFGYQLVLLGHIDNGVSVWFLALNVAPMILGMRNLAIYCGVITFTEIVGVVVGARAGWFPAGRVVVPEADVVMAASLIAVLILCGLFAFIAHRARQSLTRELTARNTALAGALDETRLARNEAMEASQAKERFFANLTHEIRTPLNGIAGTAELLEHTTLSAKQQPLARALGVSTRNLIELVNMMLDHAKIAAGHTKIERAPVNLRQLAQELLGMFGALAADKKIVFEVVVAEGSPTWIDTDAVKIKQIVGNLVSNAIKFTNHGSVGVRVHCAEPAGASDRICLAFEVTDTGAGIAPERLASVFEPFVQGDASITRAHGGTGLGLSIARQLAELLGGTLNVKSTPGEGTTFTLELPVAPADAPLQAAAEQIHAGQGLYGLRVLLAEDNPINQLVARAMLETMAVAVDVAGNGLEAVALACEGGYQVILMDLQMPGKDGITATREIRLHEQSAGKRPVPIIAMTGNSPDDYGEACRQSGMDGYLMKPIRLEQLRGVLLETHRRLSGGTNSPKAAGR